MNENRWYVEQRPDGHYVGMKGGAQRASISAPTQAKVIKEIRKRHSNATIDVKRVRNTKAGGRDRWRKP
jgi:hypothetical protein